MQCGCHGPCEPSMLSMDFLLVPGDVYLLTYCMYNITIIDTCNYLYISHDGDINISIHIHFYIVLCKESCVKLLWSQVFKGLQFACVDANGRGQPWAIMDPG